MAAEALDVRMARLEGSYEQIRDRLSSMDARLGGLEIKVDALGSDLRQEIGDVRGDIRQQFYWVVSLFVVTILVPIALRFLVP